jgi:phosphate transport system protein
MPRPDLDRQLIALRSDIALLAVLVDELIDSALTAAKAGSAYDARIILQREEEFERTASAIEEKTIDLLSLQQPILAHDLRLLIGGIIVGQRLQRVGHGSFGIARLVIEMSGFPASDSVDDLMTMGIVARGMLHDATVAFVRNDHVLAESVLTRENAFDPQYREMREKYLGRLTSSVNESPSMYDVEPRRISVWLWIAHRLERIADHASVIARRVKQMQ